MRNATVRRMLFGMVLRVMSVTIVYGQFSGADFSGGIGLGITQGNMESSTQARMMARMFGRKSLAENVAVELGVGMGRVGGAA